MNKEQYEAYRKTEAWAIRRLSCLDRFDGLCAMCGKKAWIAHHRTYDRIGRERLKDLTALCGPCHDHHHGFVKKYKFDDPKMSPEHEFYFGDADDDKKWERMLSAVSKGSSTGVLPFRAGFVNDWYLAGGKPDISILLVFPDDSPEFCEIDIPEFESACAKLIGLDVELNCRENKNA